MADGTIDGGTVLLYVGGVAVAYSTSCSYSLTNALRESPHKDDSGWTERASGRKNVSGSCNFWVAFTDAQAAAVFNLDDIFTLVLNGTSSTLLISNSDTGDYQWTGPAIIDAVNVTFGNLGETAEGDFSFQSNGAWSQTTVPV